MATEPTPADRPEPLVTWAAQNRGTLSMILLGLAAATLVVAIVGGVRYTRSVKEATPTIEGEKAPEKAEPSLDPSKEGEKLAATREDAGVLGAWAALLTLVFGGTGLYLRVAPPRDAEDEELLARYALLGVGGALGLCTVLLSGGLLYLYWADLVEWVTKKDATKAWGILLALAVFVVGLVILFASLQPARAEERVNPTLRRLFYGTNAVLTGLLLLLFLVVGNVLAFMKVPGQIDATEANLYSLSETTRDFVKSIDRPAHLYVIGFSDRIPESDQRAFYGSLTDLNNNIKVEYLSPILNDAAIRDLITRFKRQEINTLGVLVTYGENEEYTEYVRESDLVSEDFAGNERRRQVRFLGEQKIVTALNFLAGGAVKPVVYFTQDNGEYPVEGPGRADSLSILRDRLTRRNVEARPLKVDIANPKIPDDADVVAIVRPTRAFSEAQVKALREYLKRPGEKTGRLMAFIDAQPDREGTGMLQTGLEPLLTEYGIQLGNEMIWCLSMYRERMPLEEQILQPAPGVAEGSNLIADVFRRSRFTAQLDFAFTRPVRAAPGAGPDGPRAQEVLTTDEKLVYWTEPTRLPADIQSTVEGLVRGVPEVYKRKNVRRAAIPVAAVSSDAGAGATGSKPRMVVFGTARFLTNPYTQEANNAGYFDLFAASVDWLRERQTLGVTPPAYRTYTLSPKEVDTFKLFSIPFWLMVFGIGGLGAGVWLVRRK